MFPPNEGSHHIPALLTVALRDFLHLKPRHDPDDTEAISLLVAFYDTQGIRWVYSVFFLSELCPTQQGPATVVLTTSLIRKFKKPL